MNVTMLEYYLVISYSWRGSERISTMDRNVGGRGRRGVRGQMGSNRRQVRCEGGGAGGKLIRAGPLLQSPDRGTCLDTTARAQVDSSPLTWSDPAGS